MPPHQQRRGIGKRLLEHCLNSAKELGIGRFVLHSTDAGRRLYESSIQARGEMDGTRRSAVTNEGTQNTRTDVRLTSERTGIMRSIERCGLQ